MADPVARRLLVAALLATLGGFAYAQPVQPFQPTQPPKPRVYVGDSPAAQDLLEQARSMRQQNRLLEAVTLYQQVIERYPDKLMEVDGIYSDAPRRVAHDLAADPALLDAYRRNFEPLAERALAAGSAPPSAPALEAVVARYRACHAGLEAGLRLGGVFLERGDTVAAASVLDQLGDHPDLKSVAARWHWLEAVTALLSGRQDRYEAHRAALGDWHDGAGLLSLTRLAGRLRLPPGPQTYDAWAPLAQAGSGVSTRQELWQVTVNDSTGAAAHATGPTLPGGAAGQHRGEPEGSSMGLMLPQADAERIYVNCFTWIVAMDRLSGRVVWDYESVDATNAAIVQNPWMRIRAPEQRGFAFEGDHVWTVTGLGLGMRLPMQGAGPGTALLCMDRTSGKVICRVDPKDVDDSLAAAAFYGTPVAAGGHVFALMRRSQLSGFQDAFLVALDGSSGKTVWHRYLSSAAAMGRGFARGGAQMLIDAGRLYVADGVGAVACLDVRTGAMEWLSVQPDALDGPDRFLDRSRQQDNSWMASPPTLVEAGLVVPSMASGGAATLFDPLNGKVLQRLGQIAWTEGDYFTRAGRDILIVGPTMHLMDGSSLDEKWRYRLGAEQQIAPQGRAAVTADRILVPVGDRIVTIRLADGKGMPPDQPLARPGNLLALDDQLIVADDQTVRDFMEWDRAYARLKEAITAEPGNPRPAVALAYLALTAERPAPVLEGVDLALAALQHSARTMTPAQQHGYFNQLLALAQSSAADVGLRRQVLTRLEDAVSGPADVVAYHLASGDLEAQTDHPEQAIEQYEVVLMDRALASQVFERPTGSRQAGLEAQSRLEGVVRAAGRPSYQRYETMASQRLATLTSAGSDVAALLELAQQFPLARAAPVALAAAAAGLEARGDVKGAEFQLRRAYALADDPEDLGRIAGQLTQLMVHRHQSRRAVRWLERVGREHPGIHVVRDAQPIGIDSWTADLAHQPSGDVALPSLALPLGRPLTLPGRLLTPVAQPEGDWPRDLILLLDAKKLVLRSGPALAMRWEVPVEDAGLELLSLTNDQALLWSDATGTLLALDVHGGKPTWPSPAVQAALSEAGDDAHRRAAHNPEERVLNEILPQGNVVIRHGRPMTVAQVQAEHANGVFIELNDWVVCIGDRNGRVVGIDRQTGKVIWHHFVPMDEVNDIQLSEDSLLVVGISGVMSDAPSGMLVVLDPMTGEPRLTPMEDKAQITWAAIASEGTILYGAGSELVARRAGDGGVAWRMALPPDQSTARPQLCDDLLFLFEGAAGLVVVDPATGQTLDRLAAVAGAGTGAPPQVRGQDQQWQVLLAQHAMALGPDGREKWRDAIAPFNKMLLRQLVGDHCVVILGRNPEGPEAQAADAGEGAHPGAGGPVVVLHDAWPPLILDRPAQLPGNVGAAPGQPGAPARPPVIQLAPNGLQVQVFPRGGPGGGQVERRVVIAGGQRLWIGGGPGVQQLAMAGPALLPMQRIGRGAAEDPEANVGMQIGNDDAVDGGHQGPLAYRLYVLDRFTGAIREDRELTAQGEPIDPQHAVFLDNRIVLTAGATTVVVPGAQGAGK